METVLESLGSTYAYHIVMGKFNTDLTCFPVNFRLSVDVQILSLQPTHHQGPEGGYLV